MQYLVNEHYINGDIYKRSLNQTYEQALRYVQMITGGIAEEVEDRYYGKRTSACPIRTWYTIEVIWGAS